jgi:uncharacterized protein YndB with AHSA1/START domain
MAERSSAAAAPADPTLVITRVFDAPRNLVFKAWSDPEHLTHWMGPRGFTATIIAADLRPGGAYRFHLRGPEGDDHWLQGICREAVEPHRLVMTQAWGDAQGNPTSPETLLTLTFEEVGNRTRLTLHQEGFESVTSRDAHQGGWNSALDCLAEFLASVSN